MDETDLVFRLQLQSNPICGEAATELTRLSERVAELEKIAAFVPARIYIKAKEDAGYALQIGTKDAAREVPHD